MRTIGKKNIKLVRQLTREAIENDDNDIKGTVIEKLPLILWDTWEGADSEINNIIDETIMED